MGRFAFGELRFGDLMKSVWLGFIASLRLDLSQIGTDADIALEGVRNKAPEKFKEMFRANNEHNN